MLNLKYFKKLFILIVGVTILIFGLILLILPGPGILIVISGLIVLSIEFVWAKALLIKLKRHSNKLRGHTKAIIGRFSL